MFPVHPTCLWKYLGTESMTLKPRLSSKFYLSWEDGLWDILRSFDIPQNSTILVPTFFCLDVIENMQAHGLKVEYYDLDDHLQPIENKLVVQLKELDPKFIVLFHAVGIKNNLVNEAFIKSLQETIFVIEDAVHLTVNHKTVSIYSDKHFLMDSIRKVVPLQGSFIISTQETVSQLQGADKTTYLYSFGVIFLWLLMELLLILQNYIPLTFLKSLFGEVAEKVMDLVYELVGDNYNPGYCPKIFSRLFKKIDINKIYAVKSKQVKLYEKKLIINKKTMYIPNYSEEDRKNLYRYPIVIKKQAAKQIIEQMRKKGLLIYAGLDDSEWCREKSVVYLPLGPHLTEQDITLCIETFNGAVSNLR